MSKLVKLNIATKQAGDVIYPDEVNAIVERINALVDFRNGFPDDVTAESVDIANAIVIGLNEKYTYSGQAVIPNISVYMLGGKLKLDTDYTLDYSDNQAIGTGKVTIYGLGAYTGSVEKTFSIEGAKYSLSYEVGEHGTAPSAKSVSVLSSSDLALPTDDNYTCLGWYYDEAFTKKANVNDILTANTTLYAKWQQNVFTLSFNANGHGTTPTAQNVATVPDLSAYALTADGWYFVGWYTDETLTTQAVEGTQLTADTVLYAKWISKEFAIVIDGTSLTLEKTDTSDDTTLEYSTDEGTTWNAYNGTAIALTSSTTIQARLKYNGNVIAGGSEAITSTYDADEDTLAFSKEGATLTVTLDGTADSDGVIDSVSSLTDSTIIATDGTDTATVKVTNS